MFVTRTEAQAFDTPVFREFLNVWIALKDGFGLPYAGGWAEQPWPVVWALTLFERLHSLEQAEQRSKPKPSAKPSAPSREQQLAGRGGRRSFRRGR